MGLCYCTKCGVVLNDNVYKSVYRRYGDEIKEIDRDKNKTYGLIDVYDSDSLNIFCPICKEWTELERVKIEIDI